MITPWPLFARVFDKVKLKCVFIFNFLAPDQPLRPELEVLLPAVWYGQLWHSLRGGAPSDQETLLGHL